MKQNAIHVADLIKKSWNEEIANSFSHGPDINAKDWVEAVFAAAQL